MDKANVENDLLETWYKEMQYLQNVNSYSLDNLTPVKIRDTVKEFLDNSKLQRPCAFDVMPLCVPKMRTTTVDSLNAARSTREHRKKCLYQVWKLVKDCVFQMHSPAAGPLRVASIKELSDCLIAQMDIQLKNALRDSLNKEKCMIRKKLSTEAEWRCRNNESIRKRLDEALPLFTAETSGIANKCMRKVSRLVRKVIQAPFYSEDAMINARWKVKDTVLNEFALSATRDGYRVSLRNLVEKEILRYLETDPHSKSGNRICGITDDFNKKLQNKWIVKLTFDARRITANISHTEVMIMLLPADNTQAVIDRCQSPKQYRTVMLWVGKDNRDVVHENMVEVFRELRDLEKYGVLLQVDPHDVPRIEGVLDGQPLKSSLAPLEAGDQPYASAVQRESQSESQNLRDCSDEVLKHMNITKMGIEFVVAADMMALSGLLGHGCCEGNFCLNCNAHKNERNIPYELVRVNNATTVKEMLKEYDVSFNLFRALNSQHHRHSTYRNFCKDYLEAQTANLCEEEETDKKQKGGSTLDLQSEGKHNVGMGSKKRKAHVPPKKPKCGDLETVLINDESFQIPAGKLVRVPRVHHSLNSRTSKWLMDHWPNYHNRFFLCTLHCHMRITESLFLALSDIAQNGNKVNEFNSLIGSKLGLNKKLNLQRVNGTTSYEKISFLGWEAKGLLKRNEMVK
jgi:hypothetical protein